MRICVLWDKWCNIFLPLVSRRQRICTGLFWREVGLPHSRFDLCPVIHWDHDPTLPPHIPSTTPEPHRKTIATANQVGGSIATYTFQCIGCFSLRHLQVSVCKYALSLWLFLKFLPSDSDSSDDESKNNQQMTSEWAKTLDEICSKVMNS